MHMHANTVQIVQLNVDLTPERRFITYIIFKESFHFPHLPINV